MCGLGTLFRPSGKATGAFNHWAISLAPNVIKIFLKVSVSLYVHRICICKVETRLSMYVCSIAQKKVSKIFKVYCVLLKKYND